MIQKETLKRTKLDIESRMRTIYKTDTVRNMEFFINNNGVPFRICTVPPDALVIEYADTWEDGDLFYIEDYENLDSLITDMIKEIQD